MAVLQQPTREPKHSSWRSTFCRDSGQNWATENQRNRAVLRTIPRKNIRIRLGLHPPRSSWHAQIYDVLPAKSQAQLVPTHGIGWNHAWRAPDSASVHAEWIGGAFSEFTGFRTLESSRFVADQLAGVFWAHDFTTALFEKLGLWGLADKGMGLYVFGGHAFS